MFVHYALQFTDHLSLSNRTPQTFSRSSKNFRPRSSAFWMARETSPPPNPPCPRPASWEMVPPGRARLACHPLSTSTTQVCKKPLITWSKVDPIYWKISAHPRGCKVCPSRSKERLWPIKWGMGHLFQLRHSSMFSTWHPGNTQVYKHKDPCMRQPRFNPGLHKCSQGFADHTEVFIEKSSCKLQTILDSIMLIVLKEIIVIFNMSPFCLLFNSCAEKNAYKCQTSMSFYFIVTVNTVTLSFFKKNHFMCDIVL